MKIKRKEAEVDKKPKKMKQYAIMKFLPPNSLVVDMTKDFDPFQ